LLVIVGLGLALCAGCGDSPEALMKDTLSNMKEMSGVLQSVKDETSAKAAAPKLKAIGARMQDLAKRGKDMNLSQEQQTALVEKYKPQMEEAVKGMFPEMMRIGMLGIKDQEFNDALKAGQTSPP
jgi:hypothetical protein